MSPKESKWVQTGLHCSKLVVIGPKKVSTSFKWWQKVLKNTPQVQKSVKKVLKICTNCQKITKQKLYYCAKKRLPKLSKIPCGLKKGPKKFKKLLKHSRKVQKWPKKVQKVFKKNLQKNDRTCPQNARKWQKAQEKTP